MTSSVHAVVPVADAEPVHRQGGQFRFVLSPRTCTTTSALMAELQIAAGSRLIEHYHPFSDENLFVVAGTLTATVEAVQVEVPADTCLFIPRGAHHSFANNGSELMRAVVTLTPLAPRPELGHVDCEPPLIQELPESVGAAR